MVDVSNFRTAVDAASFGRLRIDVAGDDRNVVAPNTSRAGKAVAIIKDFFNRATSSGRERQVDQNVSVRADFAAALRTEYGRLAESVFEGLNKNYNKPLMARDVRQILSNLDTKRAYANMSVTLPNSGAVVSVSKDSIPLATLNAFESPAALNQALQQKVERGHAIVSGLQQDNGAHPGPASMQDVSDVAWFLHMAAEGKNGGSFKAGALSISDPGGRIRAFLDSNDEVYQRKSSHLGGFVSEEHGAHRGIDVKGSADDLNRLLPHGRATILYGRIAESADRSMPQEMLFFKMESHGCRLAPPSDEQRDADGPESRPVRPLTDLGQTLGHAFSFLGGIRARATGDHGAASRKERIPGDIVRAYGSLVEAAPQAIKDILAQGEPTSKAGGIRVMMANIRQAKEELQPEADGADDGAVASTLIKQLTYFENEIARRYDGYTMNLRIGNEVILTQNDLRGVID